MGAESFLKNNMNPQADGTTIIACGNIIEVDGPFRTAVYFEEVLRFSDGHWIMPKRGGMSLIQFVQDEVYFHWWTAV